jgi:hypothetical protein
MVEYRHNINQSQRMYMYRELLQNLVMLKQCTGGECSSFVQIPVRLVQIKKTKRNSCIKSARAPLSNPIQDLYRQIVRTVDKTAGKVEWMYHFSDGCVQQLWAIPRVSMLHPTEKG